MFMSNETDVVTINDIRQLPHIYIPYDSVEHARSKHPEGAIYHFKSLVKQGWQIIAWPLVMTKPEPKTQEGWETENETA